MLDTKKRIQAKSFFYLLSSKPIGYNAYLTDDPTKVLIGHLICANCGHLWNNGMYECYFCGAPNYHLYTCIACGNQCSITNEGLRCPFCHKTGTLRQLCLNPRCPTNNPNNTFLYNLVRIGTNKSGGVFHSGSKNQIRVNSCKHCGCRKNIYASAEIKLVFNYNDLTKDTDNNLNYVFMDRNGYYLNPIQKYVVYNHKLHRPKSFNDIKPLVAFILSVGIPGFTSNKNI